MSNASLTAAHGRTRISLDCKFRRVSSISLGKYLFNKEEIHFRAPIAYRPPLFHIRREKEREREGGFTDECFSDIGSIRTTLRQRGFRSQWSIIGGCYPQFLFLPSTAMPREPYAKVRKKAQKKKEVRGGSVCGRATAPLPGLEVIQMR